MVLRFLKNFPGGLWMVCKQSVNNGPDRLKSREISL